MGDSHLFYGIKQILDTVLISAIALVFIFEGILPFAFPDFWRKMMSEAVQLEEKQLRLMGLVSLIIGLVVLLFFAG